MLMVSRRGKTLIAILGCLFQTASAFSPTSVVNPSSTSRPIARISQSQKLQCAKMGLFDFLQNNPPKVNIPSPIRSAPSFSSVTIPRSYDEIHVFQYSPMPNVKNKHGTTQGFTNA